MNFSCYRDHQNSILSLIDKEGKIVESYSYDIYGKITHSTKSVETYNPYGYTGREIDADDLYYYRARYYDPTIGRFITPDPIGFMGGDTNFYRYVGNDPVNFTDPSGLAGVGYPQNTSQNSLSSIFENFNYSIRSIFSPNPSNPCATMNQGDGCKIAGTASRDCEITNGYFAELAEREVLEGTGTYTFAHNNNHTKTPNQKTKIGQIIYGKRKDVYKPDRYPTLESIKEALTKESYNKGETITFKRFKKEKYYKRINEASIGQKVTLVATLSGCPAGQSVTFKVYEKDPMLTTAGKELIMLQNGVEKTQVTATSNGVYAVVEVELRPKKDQKSSPTDTSPSLELWQEKFKHATGTPEKFDYLWLKVSSASAKNSPMEYLKREELKFRNITWMFPLDHIPEKSYKDGERRFGANRSGGSRKHAGCDLYAPVGTKIYAMSDGLIKSHAPFYNNTNEITIDHGDYIIRYGEVKPYGDGLASGLSIGSTVRQGQHIGYVGQLVFNGGNKSMIHLEIYEKSRVSWPLTNRNNPPFQRCEGLINPTLILDQARNNLPKGN